MRECTVNCRSNIADTKVLCWVPKKGENSANLQIFFGDLRKIPK